MFHNYSSILTVVYFNTMRSPYFQSKHIFMIIIEFLEKYFQAKIFKYVIKLWQPIDTQGDHF